MKRIISLTALFSLVAVLFIGCSQVDNSLGKSIGRWQNFGLESMVESHAAGLDYVEVTMNTVIGKDTAGVRDRAALLKAQIDSSGLKIWSVHLPYSKKYDISIVDSAKRADVVNYIKDIAFHATPPFSHSWSASRIFCTATSYISAKSEPSGVLQ